jgi:hypothetical protein
MAHGVSHPVRNYYPSLAANTTNGGPKLQLS